MFYPYCFIRVSYVLGWLWLCLISILLKCPFAQIEMSLQRRADGQDLCLQLLVKRTLYHCWLEITEQDLLSACLREHLCLSLLPSCFFFPQLKQIADSHQAMLVFTGEVFPMWTH